MVLLALCIHPLHVWGDTTLFGTISSTTSYTDNISIFNRTGASTTNQLTLNGTHDLTSNVTLRAAYNMNNPTGGSYQQHIDYATVNYSLPTTDNMNDSVLRVGRIKFDIGLLESKRNNPSSRYSIYLPFSSYWPAFDSLAQSVDGIQFETTQYTNYGNITASFTYGKGILRKDEQQHVFYGYFHTNLNGTLSVSSPVKSLTLKYQTDSFLVHLNHTNISFDRHFDNTVSTPTLMPFSMSYTHDFYTAGLRYENKHMFTTSEVTWHDFTSEPLGFFVRIGTFFTPDMRFCVGYSKFTHLASNPDSSFLNAMPTWKREGVEHMVGVSKYFNNSVVKLEYRTGKGTVWFPFHTNDPNWDLLSISVVHKFRLL